MNARIVRLRDFDPVLLLSALGLVALGVLLIYSGSFSQFGRPGGLDFSHPVVRQALFAACGLFLALLIAGTDYRLLGSLSMALYVASIAALVFVTTLGDTYNFGIGQGYLTLTPLQLVRVTAAIANGGNLLVPRVVREVVDEHSNVLQQIETTVAHKLDISDGNLAIMREAMRQAAIYGPARTGTSSYVTIAAKTGTAEFGPQLADGRYAQSHAWYVGYAPYDDPEIAVVVFLEQGIGATHGGPVAKQIFDYYFGRQHLAEQGDLR